MTQFALSQFAKRPLAKPINVHENSCVPAMSDPTPQRNFVCIWAAGKTFDAARYTKSVSIEFSRVWQVGDTVNGIEQESSGLEIELGDGTELSMDEQQQ